MKIFLLAVSHLWLIVAELERLSSLHRCAILVTNHARLIDSHYNSNIGTTQNGLIGCLGSSWCEVPHKRVLFETLLNPINFQLNIKATLLQQSKSNCKANKLMSNSCELNLELVTG